MIEKYFQKSIKNQRAIKIKDSNSIGTILYWMNRDQRIIDNPAISFTQSLALEIKQPMIVFFGFDLSLNKYNKRQVQFLINGLESIERELFKKNIPLIFKKGDINNNLFEIIKSFKIGTVVTDFSPLKQDVQILSKLKRNITTTVYQVDSHNIVPCWVASVKKEYAAYTIRPKINKLIDEYNNPAPDLIKHPFNNKIDISKIDWDFIKKESDISNNYFKFDSGFQPALKNLDDFIKNKFADYSSLRNNPNADNQSNLSPYLHFGQISSHAILEKIKSASEYSENLDQFIDELVIRKELSDNFCFYTSEYDSFESFPNWSKKTLDEHRFDPREHIYNLIQFESAQTTDSLWNAAQNEMISTGKMHGYMRMYWAKKILEWSPSPEVALETAIYLNDKYSIDGNDPNGYTGIAWSIGGVHDRPWFEREIFGKVRYMSFNGCKKKFDVGKYINKYSCQERIDL